MEEFIGQRILGGIAGDIESLLNEKASAINEAYGNIGKGTKVSIGISFSPDPKGVEFDIKLSFAPDKVKQPEKIKASIKRILAFCEFRSSDKMTPISFIGTPPPLKEYMG